MSQDSGLSGRIRSVRTLFSAIGLVPIAVAVAVIGAAAAGLILQDEIGLVDVRDFFAEAGAWAPLAFIAAYVLATLVSLPGPLLTMTGGLLFGVHWATLYSLTGALVGGVLAFLVARHLARDRFERQLGPNLRQVKRGVDDEGGWFVLFARLVPIVPYAALNYGFGLTRIGLWPYTLGSVIGMAPATFGYSYLGDAGMQAVEGERGVLQAILVAIAVVAALFFVPRLVMRVRQRRRQARVDASANGSPFGWS